MYPRNAFLLLTAILTLAGCSQPGTTQPEGMAATLAGTPFLEGRPQYLASPFVTPGDRAYMVGHQDGSFPELGWHIKGEMGGIWAHPIKLMDGFSAMVDFGDTSVILKNATRFANYPMANRHDFSLDSLGLEVSRLQFAPDGMEGVVVEFEFRNQKQNLLKFDFDFIGHSDLRPTWLGERTGMADAKDLAQYDSINKAWVVKDKDNPWWVMFGSERGPSDTGGSKPFYRGNGTSSELMYPIEIEPGGTEFLRFVIVGSSHSEEAAKNTYSDLLANADTYLAAKRDRYAALAERSKLTIPDSALQQTFEWLKYNADWMIQTVPGIGTGITAGIPDYPWWFGVDSEYALRGYMAVGQDEVVYQTIHLLDSVSRAVNGNGRILHEMSTNGAVFNPGNINETPQFASLIWHVYRWNGDKEFLKKYYPTIQKGLAWLMKTNDANANGFPDGFGMMEIHGLDSEMIDVAAYTQAAFMHASLIARELGDTQASEDYLAKAMELARKINDEFWSEEFGSYADFMGTDQQALHLIEDAIVRADTLNKPWAVAELEQTRKAILANPQEGLRPFVVHHNWVVNTPMEMGIADSAKAIRALETARKYTNPFGMFVTGIDRDESAGTDEGSFQGSKVFSYTGAVMTLPTGVQAVAENNYGRPDMALDYLKRMTRSFSYALPGSMYEVSPDYGMIVQAWNLYSFAVPIVEQFFGISPMAARKEIRIAPQMPTAWNTASLEHVGIAGNSVSVHYTKKANGRIHLRVEQSNPGWTLISPVPASGADRLEIISGQLQETGPGTFTVTSQEGILEFEYLP
ncbi:alpha-L-rhamnosidase-related protein [Robiginitalea sediminis]|uniref:alpha-L-rhamnosidase-related protein n=1 Tax=Robiginitalea sediminis TaxID=1982593 RepID=UPI000B4A6D27|nr:glycogen debranching protein [Robiginitalea sediminis]